jgi:hypothetical protein
LFLSKTKKNKVTVTIDNTVSEVITLPFHFFFFLEIQDGEPKINGSDTRTLSPSKKFEI